MHARRRPASLPIVLALIAGCVAPPGGDNRASDGEVAVATAYDDAYTALSDKPYAPASGSPAAQGHVLVHVVRETAWKAYKGFVDSGLADFAAPPDAEPGSSLRLPPEQEAMRVRLPLDAGGTVPFRVSGTEPLALRLELTTGYGSPSSGCRLFYVAGPPADVTLATTVEATLPFGIGCDRAGS